MQIAFEGVYPRIGKNVFIAPTAVVIGRAETRDNANIWFGTVIRADRAPTVIDRNTNIQNNCTVHTDGDSPANIGHNATIGHKAAIHGCTIENNCLIGINAAVLSRAHVKRGSAIATGKE